jgi:DivIVA domain-containing protein
VTILLEIAVVAAVVFGAAAYALGGIEGMRPAPPDSGSVGLPDGPVEAVAVDRTRFALAFRGYRMDEVDAVLDRLRDELATRPPAETTSSDDGEPAAAADSDPAT